MSAMPQAPSTNGQPAPSPLSPFAAALEQVRQNPENDGCLFEQLAAVVRLLGRHDLEAEFQARATRANTGQSPEAFKAITSGPGTSALDGSAKRANGAAAESYM